METLEIKGVNRRLFGVAVNRVVTNDPGVIDPIPDNTGDWKLTGP